MRKYISMALFSAVASGVVYGDILAEKHVQLAESGVTSPTATGDTQTTVIDSGGSLKMVPVNPSPTQRNRMQGSVMQSGQPSQGSIPDQGQMPDQSNTARQMPPGYANQPTMPPGYANPNPSPDQPTMPNGQMPAEAIAPGSQGPQGDQMPVESMPPAEQGTSNTQMPPR